MEKVKVKIADDGEILVQGPNVMMGYYNQPQLTDEVIKDGWFHTGDIGVFEEGFLKITDRKKEMFKTSGGKYVAPQPIENKMKESPFIEQIMVVGEGKKHPSALIVPAFDAIKTWLKETENIEGLNNQQIIENKKVIAAIDEEVLKYNKFFGQVEQLKRVVLLPQEWTVDNGELTPTLKLKRKIIHQKYESVINKIYGE